MMDIPIERMKCFNCIMAKDEYFKGWRRTNKRMLVELIRDKTMTFPFFENISHHLRSFTHWHCLYINKHLSRNNVRQTITQINGQTNKYQNSKGLYLGKSWLFITIISWNSRNFINCTLFFLPVLSKTIICWHLKHICLWM